MTTQPATEERDAWPNVTDADWLRKLAKDMFADHHMQRDTFNRLLAIAGRCASELIYTKADAESLIAIALAARSAHEPRGNLVCCNKPQGIECCGDPVESEPGWISVQDRLPTTYEFAVVFAHGLIKQAAYQIHDGGRDGRKAGNWYGEGDNFPMPQVTHWMIVRPPLTKVGCSVPPTGWRCTREAGHEGPCAAVPT